jgi:hypothetical protein
MTANAAALPWAIGALLAVAFVMVVRGMLAARGSRPKRGNDKRADYEWDKAEAAARKRVFHDLANISVIGNGDAQSALFLLEQARSRYDRAMDAGDSLEAKASALLSIVAGATGAIGVFGLTSTGKPVVVSPLMVAAVAAALMGLSTALYLLRPKRFDAPDASNYLSAEIISNDNRARLAITFAARYAEDAAEYLLSLRYDRWLLLWAYASIVAAALFVLADAASGTSQQAAATASPSPVPSPTRLPAAARRPPPPHRQ